MSSSRNEVIENIKRFSESGEFYKKVELNDPVLSPAEEKEITDLYKKSIGTFRYSFKRFFAVKIANIATKKINQTTKISGEENLPNDLFGGFIITSNHFSPFENTVIRHLTNKLGKKLNIVSQVSNFKMNGIIGFLMNYADTIPISSDPRYLARDMTGILQDKLINQKNAVLIYPEQEMWFNYRKPRPPKKGAYHYSAKLSVPVLSCFVEITECGDTAKEGFKDVKYTLHILGVLYPDPEKSVKENSEILSAADYELKKQCYEKVYGKKLDYGFQPDDIAGWQGF